MPAHSSSGTPAGLVMVGLPGMAVDSFVDDLIAQGIAGVIYFARNVEAPDQVARLSDELQLAAARHGHPPLLIAIDHEGGRVQRLRNGFTMLPPAMAFGAAGDTEATYAAGRVAAAELLACGINMNLAPCADVNSDPNNPVIGTRSYGADPGAVAGHVAAFVRGLQQGGILAVAKHFPGHGATHQDSHFTLPYIDRTLAELEACELVPFRAAVASGLAAMMSAHIVVPELTADLPATLSRAALDTLLRGNLHHCGLVLTDCMEMAAISERYSPEQATQMAVMAGADLVLWSHTPERQVAAIAGLAEMERNAHTLADHAVLERLDAARARVDAARRLLGRPDTGEEPLDGLRELIATIPARAVTLVRGGHLLPVAAPGPVTVIAALGDGRKWPHGPDAVACAAAAALCAAGYEATAPAMPGGTEGAVARARLAGQALAKGGTVVCLTRDAVLDPAQAREAEEFLRAGGDRAVLIATGLPYDALRLQSGGVAMATYDDSPAAIGRAAQVLAGLARAEGRQEIVLGSTSQARGADDDVRDE